MSAAEWDDKKVILELVLDLFEPHVDLDNYVLSCYPDPFRHSAHSAWRGPGTGVQLPDYCPFQGLRHRQYPVSF